MIKTINPGKESPKIVMFDDITYSKVYAPLIDKEIELKMLIMLDDELAVWNENNPPAKRPAILWLMGGAWVGCPRAKAMAEMEYYAKRGYVVAAAEYRVTSEAVFPAQIIDTLTAVRFLKANSEEYRIDPNRIAVMGLSAGGHLAAFAAMNSEGYDSEEWNGVSSTVRAGVDMFGPSDLPALYRANEKKPPVKRPEGKMHMIGRHRDTPPPMRLSAEEMLIGGPMNENMDAAKEASPINHISDKSAPLLILHGAVDMAVVPEQSITLHDALNAAGHPTDLYLLEGAGHNTAEFFQDSVKEIVLNFLDENI